MKWSDFSLILLNIMLGFLLGSLLCRQCGPNGEMEQPEERVDTLIVRDTITMKEPIYIEKRTLDTVMVTATDTMRVHDTLYVYMLREQLVWTDSLARVYVSGIHPQVDSVEHFIEHMEIVKEIRVPVKVRNKWGAGIQLGVGGSAQGFTPYVGVGISYNLISW